MATFRRFFNRRMKWEILPPAAPAATSFTDTFVRANENPLSGGGNWTSPCGKAGTIELNSNQCDSVTNNNSVAYLNTSALACSVNQQASVVINSAPSFQGVCVRIASASVCNGYMLAAASGGGFNLFKMTDNGSSVSFVSLGTFAVGISMGATIMLQASGTSTTTLSIYYNGVLQTSFTDSSGPYTSGQTGIFSNANNCDVGTFISTNLP